MSLASAPDAVSVGRHAGWALTFHTESNDGTVDAEPVRTLSSDHHDAQIEATLPGGLEGGTYAFVVERVSDAEHRAIAQDLDAPQPSVVKLHLFWYDTTSGPGAVLANAAGLVGSLAGNRALDRAGDPVAVLSLVSVTRRAGARHYETVITARERAYERLGRTVRDNVCVASPLSAVRIAARKVGVELEEHSGFDDEGQLAAAVDAELANAMTSFDGGNRWRKEIGDVAVALEQATGRHGRGVLLIRDGKLHVGVREGPVGSAKPVDLTAGSGLVEVSATGVAGADTDRPGRRRHALVLLGRPDLKPGAVVRFDLPDTERATTPGVGAALGNALGGLPFGPLVPQLAGAGAFANPRLLYVDSVTHRLGRTTGFVTTVAGVEVAGTTADDLYDKPPPGGRKGTGDSRRADTAARVAQGVKDAVDEAIRARRLAEAGQVRAVAASGNGSKTEAPRHSETVWRGLTGADGKPNRLARLPIRTTKPDVRQRVPRTSPFAWGSTGLVVPRYPGMRVLLDHGRGDADDPVDVGALWDRGDGPDTEPGDWWLILPVGVPAEERSSLPDDRAPKVHTGRVTHDLIDADGHRVIEVGELTIRVMPGTLNDAGQRPVRTPDEGSVTIENVDGSSRIVMTSDGTVRIEAAKIQLDAGTSGEISMKAGKVSVDVTDTMDVS